MDPVRLAVLLAGAFFLAFGLAAYRHFYTVLGATAGLAVWMALKETLVRIPGLRDHPGTSSLLILVLLILAGVFFASRFRRLLAFFSGLGTGIILSQAVSGFIVLEAWSGTAIGFSRIDAMDILVGLVGGILFLLFERVFAVLLTSVVGSFLCTWAIGGKWTFMACLVIGLIAQPLVFMRFRPPPSASGSDRTGTTTLLVLGLLILPAVAAADWTVERVNSSTSRLVIAAGWRDGVRVGESYVVIDDSDALVAEFTVGDVFSDSSYSRAVPPEKLRLITAGMEIMTLEDYEFNRAMKSGGESQLQGYLEKYPHSEKNKEIMDALDEKRYRLAELSGTIDAFREFQRKYPTSRYGAKARKREEELAFEKARSVGTEQVFRDYLNRYPGTGMVSGISEVRAYLRAQQIAKVYAFRDFLASYTRSRLAEEFIPHIDEFEVWEEELEFGNDPVKAIRYFGDLGDETAVPLLVGKLNIRGLEEEARRAIEMIGEPALDILMEVLISPLQSIDLKDKVALIIGEMGDMSTIPAMRTYVDKENTPAGQKALLRLEQKVGR